jgi:hypothetical protein
LFLVALQSRSAALSKKVEIQQRIAFADLAYMRSTMRELTYPAVGVKSGARHYMGIGDRPRSRLVASDQSRRVSGGASQDAKLRSENRQATTFYKLRSLLVFTVVIVNF